MQTSFCLIFSGEHNQYWSQDQYGYTPDPNKAGFWPSDEAQALVQDAGPDKALRLISYNPSRLRLQLWQYRQKKTSGGHRYAV